jgi:hypothetical protein
LADAADWWLVFAHGDKSQRVVHYLDLASIDIVRAPSRLMTTSFDTKLSDADLIDFIRVEGVAIYESAQSPAKAATQYRVKCREQMVASTMASQLWRHDRIDQLSDQGWTAISGNALLSQIHAFACAAAKRDANGMLRVRASGQREGSQLPSLSRSGGFMISGEPVQQTSQHWGCRSR